MGVHCRVNASGYSGRWNDAYPLTASQLAGAITAAAQTWMEANPRLEVVYETTSASPGTPAGVNVNNVIGFVNDTVNCADAIACADVPANAGGERHKDTLGLGDVLGLRHLHPTLAATPSVFVP